MNAETNLAARIACALALVLACVSQANANDPDCLACHAALIAKKVVHPAVQMGCPACHADIDASAIPHKVKGKIAKGLSAEPPKLCVNCHDKKLFEGKVTHAPVAGGMCLFCHNPHASDQPAMLNSEPAKLCLGCHAEVKQKAHATVLPGGHPLGDQARPLADPSREGKTFYCAACHEPHRSEHRKLTRVAWSMMACLQCHKM